MSNETVCVRCGWPKSQHLEVIGSGLICRGSVFTYSTACPNCARELAARGAADAALAAERVANAGLRDALASIRDGAEGANIIAGYALSAAPPNAMGALRAASVEADWNHRQWRDPEVRAHAFEQAMDEACEAIRVAMSTIECMSLYPPGHAFAGRELEWHRHAVDALATRDALKSFGPAPASVPPAAAPQEQQGRPDTLRELNAVLWLEKNGRHARECNAVMAGMPTGKACDCGLFDLLGIDAAPASAASEPKAPPSSPSIKQEK